MLLLKRYYFLHGLSLQIILDRSVQFAAELFQKWCLLLEIESSMFTAYHLQMNGQTERDNQMLEQYLCCFIEHHQKNDWILYLATTEFAYNNALHKSTKHSSFFLEYSRNFRAKLSIVKEFNRQNLSNIFIAKQQAQK